MKFPIGAENIIFDPFSLKILFFSIHFNPTDWPWSIIEVARKPKDQLGVALRKSAWMAIDGDPTEWVTPTPTPPKCGLVLKVSSFLSAQYVLNHHSTIWTMHWFDLQFWSKWLISSNVKTVLKQLMTALLMATTSTKQYMDSGVVLDTNLCKMSGKSSLCD